MNEIGRFYELKPAAAQGPHGTALLQSVGVGKSSLRTAGQGGAVQAVWRQTEARFQGTAYHQEEASHSTLNPELRATSRLNVPDPFRHFPHRGLHGHVDCFRFAHQPEARASTSGAARANFKQE